MKSSAAAGQPSRPKSRTVVSTECQLPASARASINPEAIKKPASLIAEAGSRSSVVEAAARVLNSSTNQSPNQAARPNSAEKTLFQNEGPSPRLAPI